MRSTLLLAILVACAAKAFSQSYDTYQPALLYKQNNVRSRTMFYDHDKSNWGSIDYFDHDGLLIESILFDSTGKKYVSKRKFHYDSSKHFINEVFYNYVFTDSANKKEIQTKVVDSQEVKLEFDTAHNRLLKKTYVNALGKPVMEVSFTFDPFGFTEKYYKDGILSEEVISSCDGHRFDEAIVINCYSPDGSRQGGWKMKFDNSYDKFGRIKKRSIRTSSDTPELIPQFNPKRQEYFYMSNGLLVNKSSYSSIDDKEFKQAILFNYTFW